jgi:hypothetical protein
LRKFRYDADLRQRLKTVELIVEKADWTLPPPRYTQKALVPLLLKASDQSLRAQAKAADGRWDPEEQIWC